MRDTIWAINAPTNPPDIVERPSLRAGAQIRPAPTLLFVFVLVGIIIRVSVNPALVATLYPYTTPGGLFLNHIHPGSYILVLAGMLTFIPVISTTPKHANPLFWSTIGLLVACLGGVVFNIIQGNGNITFVVDSLFVAPMTLIAISYLSAQQQRAIAYALISVVVLNGVLLFIELLLHRQLLPIAHEKVNYFSPESIFRPRGLFGHPLSTGGIAAPIMPLVFVMVPSFLWKWILAIFMATSVAITQSRAATVVSALMLIVLAILSLRTDLKSGAVSSRTFVVLMTLSALIIPGIIALLYTSGQFERLMMGADDNNSAAARVVVYDIFDFMTPSEFLYGMKMDRAMMLSTSFLHMESFESNIVVFILAFGVIYTIPFLFIVYFFVLSISFGSNVYVKWSVAAFVLLASTNNALASSGPDLILVTALAFIAAVHCKPAVPT